MTSEPKDDRTNPFGTTGPWGTAYRGPVPLTPPPSSRFGRRATPADGAPLTPPTPRTAQAEPAQAEPAPANPTQAAVRQAAPMRSPRSSVISGSALPIGWNAPARRAEPAPDVVFAPLGEPHDASDADALLFDEPVLRTTSPPLEEPLDLRPQDVAPQDLAPQDVAPRDVAPPAPAALEPLDLDLPSPPRTRPAEAKVPEAQLNFVAPPARRRRKNRAGAVLFVAGGGIAAAAAIAVVVGMSERASRNTAPSDAEVAPAIAEQTPETAPPLAAATAVPAPSRAAEATAPTLRPAPQAAPERLAAVTPPAPRARAAEARTVVRNFPMTPSTIQVSPQPLKTPALPAPAQASPPEAADPLFDAETPITTTRPGD